MEIYSELREEEKRLFNDIENIFIESCAKRNSYIKVLSMLINKYKKNEDKKPIETRKENIIQRVGEVQEVKRMAS
ncbi:hypothetical protein GF336_00205 [Candidatus Woesearchaeota archaeon]|nr:hypothetical protein [Candidatus Woesearchaeota archaeon]